jgi:anti-sigma B factor antagonist
MSASDQLLPASLIVRTVASGTRSLRVVLDGELDLASAPQLEEALERAFADADDVVLDLSQVPFMDSSGLYTIVAAVRESQTNGKCLRISSSLSAQVARLLHLVGMSESLPMVAE